MIRIFNPLLLVIAVLFPNLVVCQVYDEAARRIDSLFSSYNSRTPGAAVAIIKDGKVIFKKGYGMANLENEKAITSETVFNIASVSKQFTAFAIYLLREDGRISLEDDVRKYLPELPDYGATIRIRHLLAHTSGLRDQAALLALSGSVSGDISTNSQILKMVYRQKGLNFTPGSRFNYNNTGYTLLAEIVQRVSGKTLAVFARERIIQPLGMTNSYFYDSPKIIRNKAESYERINNEYYHKPLNVLNPGPSNLLTTVTDLSKWILNFEVPVVGNEKLLKEFNEVSLLDNGSKVVLRVIDGDTIFHAKGQNLSSYKGVSMFTHGGHAGGFRTFMGRFPGQRLGVIALSNDEHNENLNARWQIADFYISQHFKEPTFTLPRPSVPVTVAPVTFSTPLKDFEGEFYNDELGTAYRIELRGDKLVMTHRRLNDVELKRTGDNKFSGTGRQVFSFEIEFLRSENGVNAFSLTNFGVREIRFDRIK